MAEGGNLPVFEDHYKSDGRAKGRHPVPPANLGLDQRALPADVLDPLSQLASKFAELSERNQRLEEENRALRDELQREKQKNGSHIDLGGGAIEADAIPTTICHEGIGMEESRRHHFAPEPDQKVHFQVGEEKAGGLAIGDSDPPPQPLPALGSAGVGPIVKQPNSVAISGQNGVQRSPVEEQYIKKEVSSAVYDTPPPSIPDRPASFSVGDQFSRLVQQNHLQFLADHLDNIKWPTFMRILGVPDIEIERIKQDYQGVVEQKYQALSYWKNEQSVNATPEKLIQTLIKRRERLIAEKFCTHFPEFRPILDVDLSRRKLKKSNSAGSITTPTQEMAGLPHAFSEMKLAEEENHYYEFGGVTKATEGTDVATKPAMESVQSQSYYHTFTSTAKDEARPSSPPSYAPGKYQSTPGQKCSPSSLSSQNTPIAVIFGPYTKGPADATLHRLHTQLLLFRGFTAQGCQALQKNLLKYQQDRIFQQKIEENMNKKTNWFEVIDLWASSLNDSDVSISDSPPHHIWNLFLALRDSRLIDLHDCMKQYLKSGTVGPCLPYTQHLTDTKWSLIHDVSQYLEIATPGAPDWRAMAEELGLSAQIPLWQQKQEGGKNVIAVFKTKAKTVGDLYAWLCAKNRHDIVACMEDMKYLLR